MPPAASICIIKDVPERGRPETMVITVEKPPPPSGSGQDAITRPALRSRPSTACHPCAWEPACRRGSAAWGQHRRLAALPPKSFGWKKGLRERGADRHNDRRYKPSHYLQKSRRSPCPSRNPMKLESLHHTR